MKTLNYRIVILYFFLFLCAGCDSITVVHEVSQTQARDIVAELGKRGVRSSVNKKSGSGLKFDVLVRSQEFTKANQILQENGLPKKERASVDELLNQSGFLPPSREMESLKIDYILGLQVDELLSNIPEIISSESNVRIRSLNDSKAGGISIIVQTEKEIDPKIIKDLVRRIIPGLSDEQVWISFFKVNQTIEKEKIGTQAKGNMNLVPFLFNGIQVPEAYNNKLSMIFLISILMVSISSAIIGYWVGLFRSKESAHAAIKNEVIQDVVIDKNNSGEQ